MNVNPNAKTILCFGDSNTYGQKPDKSGRYAADVRWTGQLQRALGGDYYVIEEGLGGRTTDLDDVDRPDRNGEAYLIPSLQSHSPLDFVAIMLGSNDLKMRFNRSAEQIAVALGGLVENIRQYGKNKDGSLPQILLISPTVINDKASRFAEFYSGIFDAESVEKSYKLASAISAVAVANSCKFLDASQSAHAGEDGLHWDIESHITFAIEIEKSLRQF